MSAIATEALRSRAYMAVTLKKGQNLFPVHGFEYSSNMRFFLWHLPALTSSVYTHTHTHIPKIVENIPAHKALRLRPPFVSEFPVLPLI